MTVASDDSGRRVTQRAYVWTWLGVGALAVASFAAASLPLGRAALPVALGIATVQAVLVSLWFMHLVEQRGSRRFVMPVGVFFVLLLLALVFADVAERYPPVVPGGIAHEVEPRPAAPAMTRPPGVTPGGTQTR